MSGRAMKDLINAALRSDDNGNRLFLIGCFSQKPRSKYCESAG